MKKFITIALFSLVTIVSFSQNSIFNKFEDLDEVSTVVVTKQAFNLMAQFNNGSPEAEEYVKLVKNIDGLRLYTTEDLAVAKEMKNVVEKYLKASQLTELMRVKDKDANIKFYIKAGKNENYVQELLMFVDGIGKYTSKTDSPVKPESVILSITGDINLNEISKLMNKMNIKGGEHLKKSDKH